MIIKSKKSLLLVMLCTLPAGLQAALSYAARGGAKAVGYAQDFAILNNVLRSNRGSGIKLEESMRGPSQVKPDVAQAEELFTAKNIKKFAAEYQALQPSVAPSLSPTAQPVSAIMVQPHAMSETVLRRVAEMGKNIVIVESVLVSQQFIGNVIQSLPQEPLLLEPSSAPVNPFHLKKEGPKNLIYIKFKDGRGLWKIDKKVVSDLYAQKILTPELYAQKKGKPLVLALPEPTSKQVVISSAQLNNFIQFATFKQLMQLQEVDFGVEILPPYEGEKATRLLDDIVTTEIFLPEEIVFHSGNVLASMDGSVDMTRLTSLNNFYTALLQDFSLAKKITLFMPEFFRVNSEVLSDYAIACVDTLQKTKDVSLEYIFEKGLTDEFLNQTYPSLDQIPFVFQPNTTVSYQKACRLIVKQYVMGLLQTVTANIVEQITSQVPAQFFSTDQLGEEGQRVSSGTQFFEVFKNDALFLLFLDYCDEKDEEDTDKETVKMRQDLFNDHKIVALFWLMIQHGDFTTPLNDLFKKFYDDTDQFIDTVMSKAQSMNQSRRAKLQYIKNLIFKNKNMPHISSLTPPVYFPNLDSFKISDVEFGNNLSEILSQISSANKGLITQKKLTIKQWNALFTPPLMHDKEEGKFAGFTGSISVEQLYLVASLQRRQYLQAEKAKNDLQAKKLADRKELAEDFKTKGKKILRDQEAEFSAIMKQFNDELLTKQEALKKIQQAEEQAQQKAADQLKREKDEYDAVLKQLKDKQSLTDEQVTLREPTADLSMQRQIADQFLSKGIAEVTFDQLRKSLIEMNSQVQATPGLLGSVQVIIWNLKKQQPVAGQEKVERIMDIVALAAGIR